MKTRAQLLAPGILVLWILVAAICNAQAELEQSGETGASEASAQDQAQKPAPSLRLPPGMACADDPKQIAALYSEQAKERAKALREEGVNKDGLTDQEAYNLKLAAYRTQLVNEQLQRERREQELAQERAAREEAERYARELERERQRESIYIQHHSVHAYQRNLNDEFWREQRLRKLLQQQQCNQPCPQPSPQPAADEASSEDMVP